MLVFGAAVARADPAALLICDLPADYDSAEQGLESARRYVRATSGRADATA